MAYGICALVFVLLRKMPKIYRAVRDVLRQERANNQHGIEHDSAYQILSENLSAEGNPILENWSSRGITQAREDRLLDGIDIPAALCKRKAQIQITGSAIPAEASASADTPYDALSDIIVLTASGSWVRSTVWMEATEVAPQQIHASIVDAMRRPERSRISEFISDVEEAEPCIGDVDERVRCIISQITKKCLKGMYGGSYAENVDKWGRGILVVGIPMWKETLPRTAQPEEIADSFMGRVFAAFDALKRTVFDEPWCPFDAVIVKWTPPLDRLESSANDPGSQEFANAMSLCLNPRDWANFLGSFLHDSSMPRNMVIRWARHDTIEDVIRSRPCDVVINGSASRLTKALHYSNKAATAASYIYCMRRFGVRAAILKSRLGRSSFAYLICSRSFRVFLRMHREHAKEYQTLARSIAKDAETAL